MAEEFQSSFWLSKGLWSLAEKGLSLCFGLGSFLILIRVLDQDAFGAWVLFTTVASILEVAKSGFLQNAFIRFWQIYPDERQQTLGISLLLNLILTLSFAIFLWFGSPWLAAIWDAPELIWLFRIHILWQFAVVGLQTASFTLQANYDFEKITWLTLLRQGMFFAIVLFLMIKQADISLVFLVWSQVFIILAVAIFGVVLCWRRWGILKPTEERFWEYFHYGKFVFGTNISAMFYKSIDKWMLGAMVGKAVVAPYEACMRVLQLMEQPTYSVGAIVFPKGAEKVKEQRFDELKMLYERAVGAILGILMPVVIVVMFFPEQVLLLLAGPEYTSYTFILRLALLIGVISPYLNQFGTLLDVIGRPNINFRCILIGVVSNILFNYFFISWLGLEGAVWGTLCSYLLLFVINQFILYRMFGITPIGPIRQIPYLYMLLWNRFRFNYHL